MNRTYEYDPYEYDPYEYLDFDARIKDISNIWPSIYSDRSISGTSSVSTEKRSGRMKKKFTMILELFFTGKRHPKREFFNAFIIRTIKKIFRSIIGGIFPKKQVIRIRAENEEENRIWGKFQALYRANVEKIKEISKTCSGPETDGKSKRNNGERAPHLSFNNEFCKEFFSERAMKTAFLLTIELIFSDFSPDALSKKLKFYCCKDHEHLDQCWNKWNTLKWYLENDYFSDIDETPAVPNINPLREFYTANESFDSIELLV